MVTGAAGSVGQELVRQLLPFRPAGIRTLDNNEGRLFLLKERYQAYDQVTAYLGDTRDVNKLSAIARGTDIIFHCAAFKHVYLSEYNPFEAVQTNIIGVQNIIQAAMNNNVKLVIFTSSDKAVNPTSVMGTSKLMGERIITAANVVNHNRMRRFCSVRFGNIIGSRGSVFSVFHDQIKSGGPVTVTDPGMTRFIMSLERAAQLVMEGAVLARGGEVFVTKMKVINIMDLAQVMIALYAPYYGHNPAAIPIKIVGLRPGEKMYEELVSQEEVRRTLELEDLFVVLPALGQRIYKGIDHTYPGVSPIQPDRPHNSSIEPAITPEEIKDFLINSRLWPEDNLERSLKICVS